MDVSVSEWEFIICLILIFKLYLSNQRPDTFVYTTADHTGFLLPQAGAYFVVGYSGINTFDKREIWIWI